MRSFVPVLLAATTSITTSLLVVGCGGGDDHPAPLAAASGGGAGAAGAAGSAGLGGAAGAFGNVAVAATDGSINLPFSFTATGKGGKLVTSIDLTANVGTLTVAGTPYAALVHEHQPWPSQGYDLFQVLAVGADRLFVAWMYCQGDVLTDLYIEGTDGTKIQTEAVSMGTCAFKDEVTATKVAMPALSMTGLGNPTGFTLQGSDVTLAADAPGSLKLGGTTFTVFPFSVVDCSKSCGSPGWWELHSLLWDPGKSRLCFAIFYLTKDSTNVQLTYAITLPDLSDPAGVTKLDATWTKP